MSWLCGGPTGDCRLLGNSHSEKPENKRVTVYCSIKKSSGRERNVPSPSLLLSSLLSYISPSLLLFFPFSLLSSSSLLYNKSLSICHGSFLFNVFLCSTLFFGGPPSCILATLPPTPSPHIMMGEGRGKGKGRGEEKRRERGEKGRGGRRKGASPNITDFIRLIFHQYRCFMVYIRNLRID